MKPPRAKARPFAPLAALVLAASLAACGGGGGGGTPVEPPPATPMIVFTPDTAPGTGSVSLAAAGTSTATTLLLEVRATQVTDFYGAAFDLAFPGAQLTFVGATPGPALTQGTVQASVSSPGNLVVGVSSLGQVPGLTGSGVLAVLRFDAVAAGEGRFAYSRNQAFRSNGQPAANVTWISGGVRVVR